jgi:hypothetical protein
MRTVTVSDDLAPYLLFNPGQRRTMLQARLQPRGAGAGQPRAANAAAAEEVIVFSMQLKPRHSFRPGLHVIPLPPPSAGSMQHICFLMGFPSAPKEPHAAAPRSAELNGPSGQNGTEKIVHGLKNVALEHPVDERGEKVPLVSAEHAAVLPTMHEPSTSSCIQHASTCSIQPNCASSLALLDPGGGGAGAGCSNSCGEAPPQKPAGAAWLTCEWQKDGSSHYLMCDQPAATVRRELGAVLLRGTMMRLILPRVHSDRTVAQFVPGGANDSMVQRYLANVDVAHMMVFEARLDYDGREEIALRSSDTGRIVMRLSRDQSTGGASLQFSPPLSAFQALSVALCSYAAPALSLLRARPCT